MKLFINSVVVMTLASIIAYGLSVKAAEPRSPTTQVLHRTIKVDNLDIFYREAGPKDAPTILLLHGFPTSSHMFRNLIPALADTHHVVATDNPGGDNISTPLGYKFDDTLCNFKHCSRRL